MPPGTGYYARPETAKVKDIWQLQTDEIRGGAGGAGAAGGVEELENLRSYKSKMRNKDTNSICAS